MHLILLPGLDGTGRLFAPFLRVLPPHFKPLVVTYPTHERLSYRELTEIVTNLLPSNKPYIIVAESFSSPIAIRLAAASPPYLRGVVLCASFAYVPGSFLARVLFRLFSRFLFMAPAPHWAVRFFLADSDAPDELLSLFYETVSAVSPSVLGYRLRIALAADERQTLSHISVPILGLLATQDRLLRRGSLEPMLDLCKDISIMPIEAPHFVLQRNPKDAIETIDKWMKEQSLTM